MKLLVAGLLLCFVFADSCTQTVVGTNEKFPATGKYSLISLSNSDYVLSDSYPSATRNFTYYVRFCNVLSEVPMYRSGGEMVQCTNGVKYTAYQVDQSTEGSCKNLGGSADDVKFELLDQHDPSVGVLYTMTNGDATGCASGQSRVLQTRINCVDSLQRPYQVPVSEYSCRFSISIDNRNGCPTSCFADSEGLCHGTGACRFDANSMTSKCVCSKGWHGDTCEEKGKESAEGFNQTSIVLIFVLVFLILVEVGIFMMWGHVKSLRLDPNAYGDLAEADELA